MVIHRNLDELSPMVYAKAAGVLQQLAAEYKGTGIVWIVLETRRELVVQMAYYARGRMEVGDVKAMYSAAGLYDLSDIEAKRPVTWTLKSKHLDGMALDLAPSKDGTTPWWAAPDEHWKRLAEVGELYGFKAGYRWVKTKDSPHLEV